MTSSIKTYLIGFIGSASLFILKALANHLLKEYQTTFFDCVIGVDVIGVNSPQLTSAAKNGLKRLPDSVMGNEALSTVES